MKYAVVAYQLIFEQVSMYPQATFKVTVIQVYIFKTVLFCYLFNLFIHT